MTKKQKMLLSNAVFLLTSLIAISMFLVKTSEHSNMISVVSFEDLLTLISPMVLIVVFTGLLNMFIGSIIVCDPVFITFKRIVFVEKYKSHIINIELNYQLNIQKNLCVFRC